MKKNTISFLYKSITNNTSAWLFVLIISFAACNGNGNNKNTDAGTDTSKTTKPTKTTGPANDSSLLTIAAINESADGKNITINFNERAAPYSIAKDDKAYMQNKELLAEALKNNIPVKLLANIKTNTILGFNKASDAEVRAYNTGEGINSPSMKIKSEPALVFDINKIDTATFNRVEYQKRFPIFKLCTNVVPNYATLLSMFNYCASQGCNNPGPYSITNCIPFQYVVDGCYARAHKMRQMIIKKYGYCCEKVFSYGNLNVKANMWGGCCVSWWYHVVPLLRMNVNFKGITYQVCYVLDPGMFTTPVTLSTWLNAQKNTTCNAGASVTSYSIQPGTAYWPSAGGYGTDPNYTYTEQTLISYKNLNTCGN
jgi:Glutaminase